MENTLEVNVPDVLTKQLKLQTFEGTKRKLVISTNWVEVENV